MSSEAPSVQRSFRLSRVTSDLLDAEAESQHESRNALADRLLNEGVRMERHPMIRFRTGPAGRREPHIVGTRLLVRQVMASLRGDDKDVEVTAEQLGVPVRAIRAAVSYYAEFAAEVDADSDWAERAEDAERARWEREQAALS